MFVLSVSLFSLLILCSFCRWHSMKLLICVLARWLLCKTFDEIHYHDIIYIILPSVSWVSSTDMAFAITSWGGTAATGTQQIHVSYTHTDTLQTLWKSTVAKPRFAYLNSCFISCPTTSDKTESKGAGGSLNAEIKVTWVLLVWKDHNTFNNVHAAYQKCCQHGWIMHQASSTTDLGPQTSRDPKRLLICQNASLLGKMLKETTATKMIKLVLALVEGPQVFLISMCTNY